MPVIARVGNVQPPDADGHVLATIADPRHLARRMGAEIATGAVGWLAQLSDFTSGRASECVAEALKPAADRASGTDGDLFGATLQETADVSAAAAALQAAAAAYSALAKSIYDRLHPHVYGS